MYSWGTVDKSMIVFATEYVPLKATMMRGGDGGCESTMYPQLSERKGPVFHVYEEPLA